MKRLMIFAIAVLVAIIILTGCGRKDIRSESGREIIDLPEGTKLVNISRYGNGGHYEYTYRKRHGDEPVEEYTNTDSYNLIVIREH